METGTKLKKLRERKRLSQEELAHLLGVSQVTVGKWEQGNSIKHEHLKKLADVFEVPLDYLLEEKQIHLNQTNNDNATNNFVGFEIIVKTPNAVIDQLFTRLDTVINLLNSKTPNSNP